VVHDLELGRLGPRKGLRIGAVAVLVDAPARAIAELEAAAR